MTNTPHIFLFPHTHISAKDLKKIGTVIGGVTICRPWFMEERLPDDATDLSWVNMKRPPESLRPKGDFHRLVAEYRLWVTQNRDKGYTSSLGAAEGMSLSEETPWEIRKMISLADGNYHREGIPDQGLKWHIILHLAREFEEKWEEAQEILERLSQEKSPLEGALEEDPEEQFLDITYPLLSDLRVDDRHLGQVIEAWFGLFGEMVPENSLLLTLDPAVIGHATDLLIRDDFSAIPYGSGYKGLLSGPDSEVTLRQIALPVATDHNALDNPVIRGLSGKTIILLED